jgi:hypothetical protein
MTNALFLNTRQQATSAALALSLTLGMLLSMNHLASQPAEEAQVAAAASAPQAHLATPASGG